MAENWVSTSRFLGLNTLRSSDEIERGESALALNSDHSTSSSVGPLRGYSLYGNQTNVSDVITRKYRYERGDGFEIQLQVRDNGTTSILEYLNNGDTRNSSLGEWLVLVSGLTTARRSDGTVNKTKVMGFTSFNDTGTDNLLFCNGTDNFSRWSGAICRANGAISAGGATITVESVPGDPSTNPTDRFTSTGSLVYRDTAGTITTVTYTGKTATTFTGCSGATASADNTGIAQAADTSTYSSVPKNNILDTAQGRVVGAGRSDAPNQWSVSRVSDFTDWTTSTTPDDAQSIDFPEGGLSTALAHMDEWFFYFKDRRIWAISFQITSVADGGGGTVDALQSNKKLIAKIGAVNQKSVININDDIWFTTPEGQCRRLFRLSGERGFQTEDVNEIIRPTIKDFEWEDCAMGYFDQERTLIAAGRSSSSEPVNDRAIIYQFSRDTGNAPRLNHGILDWFIGDMCLFGNKLHFGSSVESRSFLAFDGLSKNGAPYDWVRTERREVFPEIGARFEKKWLPYLAVQGLIGDGTTLNIQLDYDVLGSTSSIPMSLAYTDEQYIVEQPANSLNAFALNTEPLNGTREGAEDLNPFTVFFALNNEYEPYDVQLTFSTSGVGQNVEITAYGFSVRPSGDHVDSEKIKAVG